MRRPRQHAFTLIEILIVVVILGILATIIIGVFNNTTADASASALRDDLRNMRNQLQLYNAEHGVYPSLDNFEKQMVLYTDAAGNTSSTRTSVFKYGPYIVQMPRLPVGTNKGETDVTSSASYSAGYAWSYDPTTGQFKANLPDTDVDGQNVAFNTY